MTNQRRTTFGIQRPARALWISAWLVLLNATAMAQGMTEAGDAFSLALASGDFDGDGRMDLAIGIPGEDIGSVLNAGAVEVRYASGQKHGISQATLNQSTPNTDDFFGWTLAAGDFDADGRDDLAISAPFEDLAGLADVGVVHVIYGSAIGLDPKTHQVWRQGGGGGEVAEAGDQFGLSLVAADFGRGLGSDDGADDLAIGAPNEDVVDRIDAGSVSLLFGRAGTGLTNALLLYSQNVGENSETRDYFGASLAAGNFGYGPHADLAVGVPGEDLAGVADAGLVTVLYSDGIAPTVDSATIQLWSQNSSGVADTNEANDQFGRALRAGNFNGDGFSDLVVGVPFETLNVNLIKQGAAHVIYGGANGLGVAHQFWHQDVGNLLGTGEQEDYFGSAFAAGDFNDDGIDDLAIGVQLDVVSGIDEVGAVNVLYGRFGGTGLSELGNQLWHQDSPDVEGTAHTPAVWGYALAAGDFDFDGTADLAVGAYNATVGALLGAGSVNLIEGRLGIGLTGLSGALLTESTP